MLPHCHKPPRRFGVHTVQQLSIIMLRSCLSSTKLFGGAKLLGKAECFSTQKILALNDLSHNAGAVQKVSNIWFLWWFVIYLTIAFNHSCAFLQQRKRWGRGIGSGRGKNCGYGHQYSPSTPRAFEGGQTPLYKRLPKIGFKNVKLVVSFLSYKGSFSLVR